MLTLWGGKQSYCDGMHRRSFLKIGGLGLGGLALPDILRLRDRATAAAPRPKAVIMICLPGGPSHLEMYDLKPEAKVEIRGEFKPTATNVPGFDICELMPMQAQVADKLALVRNMRFNRPDHALHEIYTGFPGDAKAPFTSPPIRPAFGSIISKLQADRREVLPRYISLGLSDQFTVAASETPLYLGPAYSPFEPTEAGLQSLVLKNGLTLEKLDERQALKRAFDGLRRDIDAGRQLEAVDRYNAQALEMLTSPKVRDALDVSQEPQSVRELYGPDIKFKQSYQQGHTWFNSKVMLARRLVEAGVPVVTLALGAWDDHGPVNAASPPGGIFERMREKLPVYDRTIHALVTDLHQRGLDKDVAVVVWGEFGRTPRVNSAAGRDHWVPAGFALFFGGGFTTGQVIGRTDGNGERPVGKAYTPQNVFASLYHVLGVNPATTTYPDPSGRPIHLLEDCERIAELG